MAEKTILVIDDDIDLVEIIRVGLEQHGFRVIDAQSGERGFELARSEVPDLVLLDVMMGTVDEGFQVAYRLRGDGLTRNIPIVMLTAVGDRTG
ncbi:MAG TPA: response regulator, partial [Candidatus Krumholzibacteria bacterium]|nr:response regulator [Candidatus Krumholzibacteria bacterium]